MRDNVGFHLIELLITLVIIAILASISIPLYSQHLIKEHRLEAAAELSKLAIAVERYHIEHDDYADISLTRLGFPEFIVENNYHLILQIINDEYQLMAQPLNRQAEADTECGALILFANGEKKMTGSGKVDHCW